MPAPTTDRIFPMHTIIPTLSPEREDVAESPTDLRQPHFECEDRLQQLKLTVFVPGVEPSGVEITTRGPDLVVSARKPHPVRVNWPALRLESVSHDYHLRLRLGLGFDFEALQADLRDGILTIAVPKRGAAAQRPRRVA